MITIILPAQDVEHARELRDMIRGVILRVDSKDSAVITDRGVAICTEDPVRVIQDLDSEGFIF